MAYPDRFDPSRGGMRQFLLGLARNVALKRWRDGHRWEELDGYQVTIMPLVLTPAVARSLLAARFQAIVIGMLRRSAPAEPRRARSRLFAGQQARRR